MLIVLTELKAFQKSDEVNLNSRDKMIQHCEVFSMHYSADDVSRTSLKYQQKKKQNFVTLFW